jgi:hypothetical protein
VATNVPAAIQTPRKLTLARLIAATFFIVAGGPFGRENIIARARYRGAILILPEALTGSELARAAGAWIGVGLLASAARWNLLGARAVGLRVDADGRPDFAWADGGGVFTI